MEDLCNKNRQDGKQVFQFSTKMRLFVILLDVIKTKSPLATSAILWSAKVNNTGFFFFRSLTAMFVSRCFCFWCYCCCLSQHIFAVCEKMVNISYILWGGGRQKTLVNIYEHEGHYAIFPAFKYLTKTQLRAFWIVEGEIQINETEQWNAYFITKNLKKIPISLVNKIYISQ